MNHVEVIVQPGGQVIVTGYAHTRAERERILETIVKSSGIQAAMADIKVVDQAKCPVCAPGAARGG